MVALSIIMVIKTIKGRW